MRVITLEDHFSTESNNKSLPDPGSVAGPYERVRWAEQRSRQLGHDINSALFDLGAGRIKAMDEAGIDVQIMSLTTPGCQGAKPEFAAQLARETNDLMQEAISKFPKRLSGFAAIPTSEPSAAVEELNRGVKSLGLKGALITGHTQGQFLDDKRFWPIFEAAQALDVPIYLHPGTPHPMTMQSYFKGYEDLARPAWGFAMDASTHFLRIVFSGAFDNFPKLKFILGHLGEGLPFGLTRLNDHTLNAARNRGLKKEPKAYIRENLVVTTSGNFCHSALKCTIEMLGIDNVMFSVDWPYESNKVGTRFLQDAPLKDEEKEKLAFRNAERILRLG
ncbi:amidohydrolase family protein [Bradyrhizobium japonicum]|uniref:amidohydrolase family protein n=1 Tax=Bradyrhizobium japonicum TaxID=375 RepID=UPI0003FB210C|nr:amidohydrolase family protein [Bradyrhizobium japonicum]